MSARVVINQHGLKLHVGGRKRPKETPASHPHLFKGAHEFMVKGVPLPTPPDEFSYFDLAQPQESDILGNDTLGDCTACGAIHGIEAVTAAAGAPVVFSRADAVDFYSLSTGYNPNDPSTDQGGDEVAVCTYWRDHGIDGKGSHAITGWLSIDPTNQVLVKQMAWLFGILYFGLELDASWPQNTSGSGFVWDVGTPSPNDGHCVVGCGATLQGVLINSWGMIGTLTWAAVAQFAAASNGGNVFVVLTQDVINVAQQKSPDGFDWASLQAWFDSVQTGMA